MHHIRWGGGMPFLHRWHLFTISAMVCAFTSLCPAQSLVYPIVERFDTCKAPALPIGWKSSQARAPGSTDFATSASSANSPPNAVLSTNATLGQWLATPPLDFRGWIPDSVSFSLRRSSSHTAGVVLEVSTDSGATYRSPIGDTLRQRVSGVYEQNTVSLDRSFAGLTGVVLRWRVIPEQTGTSATLRIDDTRIDAHRKRMFDVRNLEVLPRGPDTGDSLHLHAIITATGDSRVDRLVLSVFRDIDRDSIPDTGERIGGWDLQVSLGTEESMELDLPLTRFPAGGHHVILSADAYSLDGCETVVVFTDCTVQIRRGSVIVNEIQYAPATGEPEWIELFNTTPDTLTLTGWSVSDLQVGSKHNMGQRPLLLPGSSFAIVTGDTQAFVAVRGRPQCLLIGVVAFPSLNNTGDAVVIFDEQGRVVDSVHYMPSLGGGGGVSLERIDPRAPSIVGNNWSGCLDSAGATPGRHNSVVIQDVDLQVVDLRFQWPGMPEGGEPQLLVQNVGRRPVAGYNVVFYDDINGDSLGSPSELLHSEEVVTILQPGENRMSSHWLSIPVPGHHTIVVEVQHSEDLRVRNNHTIREMVVSIPSGSLCVNEVMYEPLQGEAEYVELLNTSAREIELRQCILTDRPTASGTTNRRVVSCVPKRLRPGEFCVLASDSSLVTRFPWVQDIDPRLIIFAGSGNLGLNNDGDCVVIRGPDLVAIDSVAYSPDWHNPEVAGTVGRSLERIAPNLPPNDSRSWSSSVHGSGGTPGLPNSVYAAVKLTGSRLACIPNPFSPDGDGYQDFTIIRHELPLRTGIMRLRIFDIKGRLIRILRSVDPVGPRGEIVWDGRDQERRRVRIGVYIILLEVYDQQEQVVLEEKGTVIVAGRL